MLLQADDDTFVRVRKLCEWLHQFDKERFGKPPGPLGALYIGRPGWGRKEESNSLELGFMGEKRSYCLGGKVLSLLVFANVAVFFFFFEISIQWLIASIEILC